MFAHWIQDFFPFWRADSNIFGFATELAGCVWTEATSGKKKLWFQKYLDACKQGLNYYW